MVDQAECARLVASPLDCSAIIIISALNPQRNRSSLLPLSCRCLLPIRPSLPVTPKAVRLSSLHRHRGTQYLMFENSRK